MTPVGEANEEQSGDVVLTVPTVPENEVHRRRKHISRRPNKRGTYNEGDSSSSSGSGVEAGTSPSMGPLRVPSGMNVRSHARRSVPGSKDTTNSYDCITDSSLCILMLLLILFLGGSVIYVFNAHLPESDVIMDGHAQQQQQQQQALPMLNSEA
jgi:hypothetical protein